MPELVIGDTAIPWEVTYSPAARRKRIEVTPWGVRVIAPEGTPLDGADGIVQYVRGRRRWVYDAVQEVDRRAGLELPQHFETGSTVLYRGRHLRLTVTAADCTVVVVECRSRFNVTVPQAKPREDRPAAVSGALLAWMKERALDDARTLARRHGAAVGLKPRVRLAAQQTMWGSCGKDGVLRINWRLVQAPAAAMEYVVAHEVCHLVERNHTDRFWDTLGEILPDWRERKALLERWEREQRMARREL